MRRPSYLDASLNAATPFRGDGTPSQHLTPPQQLRQGSAPHRAQQGASNTVTQACTEDHHSLQDDRMELQLCQAVGSVLGQQHDRHLGERGLQDRHCEIMAAIRSITVELPRAAANAAHAASASVQEQRHQEVMEAIRRIAADAQDSSETPGAAKSIDACIQAQNEHLGIIAARLHALERELLQGQGQTQLLEAISHIAIDPPGLSQILASAVSTKANLEAQGQSLATIDQRLRTLETSLTQVNLQQNHAELLSAMAGTAHGHTDLSPILAAMNANGGALKGLDQRLQGLERELLQDVNLRQNHMDVLEAIASITAGECADLGPMLSEVGASPLKGQTMSKVERHLLSLEKTGSDQKRALEVLLQSLPENLDKQLLSLKANLKKLGETLRTDLNSLQVSLGAKLADLRGEMHEYHADGGQELQRLEQAVLVEVKQSHMDIMQGVEVAMRCAVQGETSEMLEAMKHAHVSSGGVHNAISSKMNIDNSMDNSVIMEAVQGLPDPDQIAGCVLEKMRNYEIKVESSDILQAVSKMREPEWKLINKIAQDLEKVRVHLERSSGAAAHAEMRVFESIDISPILDAISKIKIHVAVDEGGLISQTISSPLENHHVSDSFNSGRQSSASTLVQTLPTMAEQLASRRRSLEKREAEVSSECEHLSLASPACKMKGSSQPWVQEFLDSADAPHACLCGYCCGTRSALERHLQRFPGDKRHRAAG